MKAKTARRRLRRNHYKMARAIVFGKVSSYRGIGKNWKTWTKAAMSSD